MGSTARVPARAIATRRLILRRTHPCSGFGGDVVRSRAAVLGHSALVGLRLAERHVGAQNGPFTCMSRQNKCGGFLGGWARGAVRMKQMIDDLLIFTRTRLGDLLPVGFTAQNMGRICSDAVDEVRASYPDARIDLRLDGDLRGRWDGGRIGQLIVNLLTNAVRYGSGQIVVEASARDGWVMVAVANEGNPIPERGLPTLFDPLTRATMPDRRGMAAGIGLGLYICRCIASAHQGTISVVSSAAGPRFTVAIPALPSSPA
ncbi:hypothetical protein PT2222_390024 [Paraburkholderia tropica]